MSPLAQVHSVYIFFCTHPPGWASRGVSQSDTRMKGLGSVGTAVRLSRVSETGRHSLPQYSAEVFPQWNCDCFRGFSIDIVSIFSS